MTEEKLIRDMIHAQDQFLEQIAKFVATLNNSIAKQNQILEDLETAMKTIKRLEDKIDIILLAKQNDEKPMN